MKAQYSPQVWQHFRAPRHAGVLDEAGILHGEARTPAGHAVLSLYLQVRRGRIGAARFQSLGCPSTIATAEWLCQWLEGRSVAEARNLTVTQLAEALDLVPVRRHCAVMAEDALRAALGNQGLGNGSADKMSNKSEVKDT